MEYLPEILFFDSKNYDKEFFSVANKSFNFPLKFLKNQLNIDTASLVKGYEVICTFVNDDLSSDVAKVLVENGVKLVALRCAGYNNVELKAFSSKIKIVRVPSYSPNAVAEHTLALIFSLNRKTYRSYVRTRDNNFAISGLMGFDLINKSAGIIGTGKIGRLVAEFLNALGMKVLVYDVHENTEWACQHNITYVELPELFYRSDIISLHCPLTRENHHLINHKSIDMMKEGVMLINTGRGGLIDTRSLIDGLKSKKIGYAGLDVYEEEDKYFFEDLSDLGVDDDMLSRLLSFPNVLVTSHQGFFTREAFTNIANTTLQNIASYFNKGSLNNEIFFKD